MESVTVRNFCNEYADRVENIKLWIYDIAYKLSIQDQPVYVMFREYTPAEDGPFRHGGHDPGHDGYKVDIWVWDALHQPEEALKYLIAHELRHVFQTVYDVEFGESEPESFEEYRRTHDDRGEERDADRFAKQVTGFDGLAWERQMGL